MIKCCLNCKDRVLGCHAYCEKYINEKAENEKDKANKREWLEADAFSKTQKARFTKVLRGI